LHRQRRRFYTSSIITVISPFGFEMAPMCVFPSHLRADHDQARVTLDPAAQRRLSRLD